MDLVCPKCLGPLATTDGEMARCANHPGDFRILFSRWRPAAPPPLRMAGDASSPIAPFALAEGAVCAQHSGQAAAFACGECGTPLCTLCAFEDVDHGQICPSCAASRTRRAGPDAAAPAGPPIPAGMRCAQHSEVEATWQCRACGGYMCDTCDFLLPGGIHVCPTCATKPRDNLSPRRKKQMVGAYALAIWSTLALAALMSGAFAGYVDTKEGEIILGVVLMFIVLIPSIIGMSVGFSAVDRRLVNPISLWIAVIWNGVIVAGWILLSIIGTFS